VNCSFKLIIPTAVPLTGAYLCPMDNENPSITQKWETIEAGITTAANKIIGNNTNKIPNEWFD
jgi:hypothetical protein